MSPKPAQSTAQRQLAEDIRRLRDKLEHHRRRVIIEDIWGNKYDVAQVLAVGVETDDPGVALKIRMVAE